MCSLWSFQLGPVLSWERLAAWMWHVCLCFHSCCMLNLAVLVRKKETGPALRKGPPCKGEPFPFESEAAQKPPDQLPLSKGQDDLATGFIFFLITGADSAGWPGPVVTSFLPSQSVHAPLKVDPISQEKYRPIQTKWFTEVQQTATELSTGQIQCCYQEYKRIRHCLPFGCDGIHDRRVRAAADLPSRATEKTWERGPEQGPGACCVLSRWGHWTSHFVEGCKRNFNHKYIFYQKSTNSPTQYFYQSFTMCQAAC